MKLTRRSIIGLIGSITAFPFRAFARIKEVCYTGSDVSGPFYRPEAPFRHDLVLDAHKFPGAETVVVSGIVYAHDCQTPLPNAVVDVWQANPVGKYDMDSPIFFGRAKILTDSAGKYWFKTYIPGYYTDAGLARPRHIHLKVSANAHQPLITQLYFKGDKRLSDDPFVKAHDGLKRAIDFSVKTKEGHLMTFDIYLKPKD